MNRSVILTFILLITCAYAQDEVSLKSPSLKIKMHKENYVFPYYKSNGKQLGANQSSEFKFQISVKFEAIKFEGSSINLAYTQKAFWQIYDGDASRPFRETNYNPEVFYRLGGRAVYMDLGYEHESNGEKDPISRSWDRVYVKFAFQTARLRFAYKAWVVLDEEKFGVLYPERDESMKYYYGSQEIDLGMQIGTTVVKLKGRYNSSSKKGYYESMLLWPLAGKLLFGFSYNKGYGDNLRNYNRNHETYGFGLLMNP